MDMKFLGAIGEGSSDEWKMLRVRVEKQNSESDSIQVSGGGEVARIGA